MIWFIIILVLIILKSITMQPVNSFNSDYLSKDTANIIKGIFVFYILINHATQYFDVTGDIADLAYRSVRMHMKQLVVVMFFFYSGYGMVEQLQKKKGVLYQKFTIPQIFASLS